MRPGQILIGGVILMSVLIALGACVKLRESRTQPVRPHDGDDMIHIPIDQSVLYGVWKNEDINAVIEVSGDNSHMIVTENGKLIFEGDVRLKKFGDLRFTDGKDGDGNDSGAPYPALRFNTNENVYEYRHLFDGTVVTFIKQAE